MMVRFLQCSLLEATVEQEKPANAGDLRCRCGSINPKRTQHPPKVNVSTPSLG